MYCLENIQHTRIPNDVIKLYLEIYPFIGRNAEMLQTVSRDFEVLVAETIRHDAYAFAMLHDIKLSESRFKHFLTKDIQPKTKDERWLKHIKQAFEKIHEDPDSFNLITTEVADLLKFLYKDITPESQLQYARADKKRAQNLILLATSSTTKRELLENLINAYKTLRKKGDFEASYLIVNFFVDFINLKPFLKHNEVIARLLLYILLIGDGYRSLHLSSLFTLIYKRKERFDKLIKDASHNWSEGLADVIPLHRFLLELLAESYKSLHELLRNYTFDQQTNKSDYIENTINKLDEVFTKEQIRVQHPTISDSTINRTLRRLRDEKKIRPLGKGRSAKWMKLYKSNKKSLHEQIALKV